MCIRKVDVIIIAAMTPKKGLKDSEDTRRITPWQDLKQFIHVIAGDLAREQSLQALHRAATESLTAKRG